MADVSGRGGGGRGEDGRGDGGRGAPHWLWAVLCWAAVVVAASSLAWVAISRAGEQVLGAPASPLVTSTPGASGPGSPASGTSPPAPTDPQGSASSAPGAGASVEKAATVVGGHVVVRCTGADIALRAATPEAGWTVSTDPRGGTELRIEFASAAGESEVRATCADGTPVLDVKDGGRDDSGGGNSGGDDSGGDDSDDDG